MIKRHHYARGFTLVETLVAITVLVIAIVGPLYAVHKSVTASYTARDSLIATALAQEGIEYVRSIRDGNYHEARLGAGVDWLDGLSICMLNGVQGPNDFGCTVDPHGQGSIAACGAGDDGCPKLRRNSVSHLYRQNTTDTTTRFARKITIETVSITEVKITATVSWSTVRIPYTVTVTEYLHKWQ